MLESKICLVGHMASSFMLFLVYLLCVRTSYSAQRVYGNYTTQNCHGQEKVSYSLLVESLTVVCGKDSDILINNQKQIRYVCTPLVHLC